MYPQRAGVHSTWSMVFSRWISCTYTAFRSSSSSPLARSSDSRRRMISASRATTWRRSSTTCFFSLSARELAGRIAHAGGADLRPRLPLYHAIRANSGQHNGHTARGQLQLQLQPQRYVRMAGARPDGRAPCMFTVTDRHGRCGGSYIPLFCRRKRFPDSTELGLLPLHLRPQQALVFSADVELALGYGQLVSEILDISMVLARPVSCLAAGCLLRCSRDSNCRRAVHCSRARRCLSRGRRHRGTSFGAAGAPSVRSRRRNTPARCGGTAGSNTHCPRPAPSPASVVGCAGPRRSGGTGGLGVRRRGPVATGAVGVWWRRSDVVQPPRHRRCCSLGPTTCRGRTACWPARPLAFCLAWVARSCCEQRRVGGVSASPCEGKRCVLLHGAASHSATCISNVSTGKMSAAGDPVVDVRL